MPDNTQSCCWVGGATGPTYCYFWVRILSIVEASPCRLWSSSKEEKWCILRSIQPLKPSLSCSSGKEKRKNSTKFSRVYDQVSQTLLFTFTANSWLTGFTNSSKFTTLKRLVVLALLSPFPGSWSMAWSSGRPRPFVIYAHPLSTPTRFWDKYYKCPLNAPDRSHPAKSQRPRRVVRTERETRKIPDAWSTSWVRNYHPAIWGIWRTWLERKALKLWTR